MTEPFLLRDEAAETDAAIIAVEESAGKRSGRAQGQRSCVTPVKPSRSGGQRRRGDRLPHHLRRLQSPAAHEEVRVSGDQRQMREGR